MGLGYNDAGMLVVALQRYVEAAQREQVERDSFKGYSWDYYGRFYIEEREKAAEAFTQRLNEYIDARIEQKFAATA